MGYDDTEIKTLLQKKGGSAGQPSEDLTWMTQSLSDRKYHIIEKVGTVKPT